MYDTSRFLRWLCSGLLVCASTYPAVAAMDSVTLTVTNRSSQSVYWRSYTGANRPTSDWWYWSSGTLAAGAGTVAGSGTVTLPVAVFWYTNSPAGRGAGNSTPGSYDEKDEFPAGGNLDAYWDGGGVPSTNTCGQVLTLVNTEGGPYAQFWQVFWEDNLGALPVWSGYIQPNGSQRVSVTWDTGSGHCPGQLRASGDRIGFDTPTNIVATSTNGTRGLTDPGNSGSGEVVTGGNRDTNNLTVGNLSDLLAELKKVSQEKTQQGATNLLGQVISRLGQLTNGNGGGTVTIGDSSSSGLATESTLRTATNFLSGALAALQDLTNRLQRVQTNVSSIDSNFAATLAMTNYGTFTNSSDPSQESATAAGLAFESNLVASVTPGYYSNQAGVWGSKFKGLDGMSGGGFFTNLPSDIVGSDPDTSDHWLKFEQPSLAVGDFTFGRGWSWGLTPALPSSPLPNSAANAVIKLIRMCWVASITFLLFWDIRNDIQTELRKLFLVPETRGFTPSVYGTSFPVAGKIAATAVMLAIIWSAGTHLTGWLTEHFGGWVLGESYSFNDVAAAVQSGSVNGSYSVWLPRVAMWVGQAFPFGLGFAAIVMWCTYILSRDMVLRVAYAAIKRSLPNVVGVWGCILILFLPVGARSAVFEGGSDGQVEVVAAGVTNNVVVTFPGAGAWCLQPLGDSGGAWRVPRSLESVQVGGVSNYVGDLRLGAGSSVLCANDGSIVVSRSDEGLRESELLKWGTSGLICGFFFGCLSVVGYTLKKGLFPAAKHWAGGE